ncbi:hypothetical protein PTSG_04923 [Salpingoeca rosetta]|uniref:Geranylgeranyl transferase type-2 subunit alpha n=1 Tax=Salpingoeca rosetta (strain ATCC 50818 / BSB-021) TaxID=946362 RepID=F2U906_SALR5|nr:uncharacterized protein PTSG_04923 [Salpingoeca rosetta]EGD73209.1 hypothetical protein PTSG_04923 [Salpingoeca rosetta]|eukprot:XP_004994240.1 hypothetical protein PTSG_04923 [Salpingoeca rosetta]
MHGRVKVRTSAEQAEIKRKERQKQAQQFAAVKNKIFTLRAEGSHAPEAMDMTARLLEQNPDVATLFNYRREILLHNKKDMTEEEYAGKIKEELQLSTTCLKRNPKSYSAWHHRRWCVLQVGGEDVLQQELALTTRYLGLDERNFHCWDYRRFVVSQIPPEAQAKIDEKQFAKVAADVDKVVENFSNYSAWHYRSKLLMAEHSVQFGLELPAAVWKEELALVTDPIFIDPVDQSSWIYLQWLLTPRPAPARPRVVFLHNRTLVIVCDQPVKVADAITITSGDDGGARVCVQSSSCVGRSGAVWTLHLAEHCPAVTITAAECDGSDGSQPPLVTGAIEVRQDGLWRSAAAAVTALPERVQGVVDMLLELLADLTETDMRACLQTLAYAYTTHVPDAADTKRLCLQWFTQLQTADPLRRGFYREMCSRLNIAQQLSEADDDTTLSLSSLHLSCLDGIESACHAKYVDVSDNALTTLARLSVLPRVESVNASGNHISTLDMAWFQGLSSLQRVDVRNNPITSVCNAATAAPPLPRVEVHIGGGAVQVSADVVDALKSAGWTVIV